MDKELEKYFDFKLTPGQEKAVDKLFTFFESEKEVFILKGYAGTGKTSLIKGVIKYLADRDKPYSLMASTGRAAKILSEKTGIPAGTVHSSIYRPKIIEFGSGKGMRIEFDLAGNYDAPEMIYFVDEASMISDHAPARAKQALTFGTGRLLTDMFMFAGKRKIVFIGDTIQLPPVNTRFSAALNKDYLKTHAGKKVSSAELTEIMRYSGKSGIAFNTENIRKTVLSGRYPYLSVRVSGLDDSFVYNNEDEMVAEYARTILRSGVNNAMFVVLSNYRANDINKKVRSLLFKRKRLNALNPNESLIVVKNNYLYKLLNGDHVYYLEGNKTVKKAGLEFIKVQVRSDEAEKGARIIEAYIIKELLLSDKRDLTFEQEEELMTNFYSRMTKIAGKAHSIVSAANDRSSAIKEIKEMLKDKSYKVNIPNDIFGKNMNKTRVKESFVLENIGTDPFLNALRVKYGYAVTCHKAQGGEWQDVFIIFEPSLFRNDKETQYRWAYTAISRAEKRVHYLNNMCIY
jgi:hypothetical protein